MGARTKRSALRVPFLVLLPTVVLAGHSGIAKFSGHYTAPATYCSELGGTVLKPCDPPSEDSMLINPIDATHSN
jgi:hypothetical protein